MSSYIHFFVRKGDVFTELNVYSRSCGIYQMFEEGMHVPYEKITPVSMDNFWSVLSHIRKAKGIYKGYKTNTENMINKIAIMNNSVEDKVDAMNEHLGYLKEYNEDIEELEYIYNEVCFYKHIAENYEYSDTDINEVIYIGIECGGEVSVEDIE